MSQVLTPTLICSERIAIERVRELPVAGQILKQVGEQVSGADVVARAELPGDLEIVKLAEHLGVEPFEVEQRVRVRMGERAIKGQVLAEDSVLWGLLKSTVHSPVDGVVEFFTPATGNLGIRLASRPVELKAYLSGTVTHITPGKNLTLSTHGTLVQGIFGVGGERLGKLACLPVDRTTKLTPEHIPPNCTGLILVGGMSPSIDALRAASERGAVGLVTGSIDDLALRTFVGYDVGVAVTGDEDISMSLIVTEGFGQIPISEHAFNLLNRKDTQLASLNGTTQVRAGAIRPEIVVSDLAETDQSIQPAGGGLALGARIRLIRYPYFGQFGQIVELPHAPKQIESGASTRVLMAKLEGTNQIVCVPRANVELMTEHK